jgi:hypothetical protein
LRRINLHEWARAAQPEAADIARLNVIAQPLCGNFAVKGLLDGETARRDAPRRSAATDAHGLLLATLMLGNLVQVS